MTRHAHRPAPRRVITGHHVHAIQQHTRGNIPGALKSWRQILRRNPRDPKALFFIAIGFYQTKQLPRAITYMRACLQEDPKNADAWYNMGKFLQDAGDLDAALKHYIAALEIRPTFLEAYSNAGNLFLHAGDTESAMGCYHMALAQEPRNPEARYNRSFLRLLKGDYAGGFLDYEARWACPAFASDHMRPFMQTIPMWDGSPLNGRRILLHAEQGMGDAIQYARWAHASEFVRPVIEVHKPLTRLVEASFPDAEVIERGAEIPADVELQCPLMSLPPRFGTDSEEAIPRGQYLAPPTTRTLATPRPNVALVWAGSSTHPNDADRSTTLDTLASLMEVPGVTWHSLQIGDRADEARAYPALHRHDAEIGDMADTATLLASMDLLITVDTSIAHLAGALGVKTWCMVPSVPEFRWLLNRQDTPWYPSMALWRRGQGGWGEMVQRMVTALRERQAGSPQAGMSQ